MTQRALPRDMNRNKTNRTTSKTKLVFKKMIRGLSGVIFAPDELYAPTKAFSALPFLCSAIPLTSILGYGDCYYLVHTKIPSFSDDGRDNNIVGSLPAEHL